VKIIRQNSNLLIIEQKPTESAKLGNIIAAVALGGCLIAALILAIMARQPLYFILVALVCPLLIPEILNETATSLCTFDKNANRLTVKQQSWLGKKLATFPLNTVRSVQLKSSVTTAGEHERVEVYEIELLLESGSCLGLNRPTMFCDRALIEPIFSSLKDFLNL
jgi:hypothetical protein